MNKQCAIRFWYWLRAPHFSQQSMYFIRIEQYTSNTRINTRLFGAHETHKTFNSHSNSSWSSEDDTRQRKDKKKKPIKHAKQAFFSAAYSYGDRFKTEYEFNLYIFLFWVGISWSALDRRRTLSYVENRYSFLTLLRQTVSTHVKAWMPIRSIGGSRWHDTVNFLD